MTVSGNEQPNGDLSAEGQALQQVVDNTDAGNNGGHPAWQEILDVLPDSLHSLVTPTLEKWDKGVQERFNQFHQKYDPYKDFVEQGVDTGLINQALGLVQQLEQNPESVIQQAIDAFGLDYVKKELIAQQQAQEDDDEDTYYSDSNVDLSKDPRYKAMEEAVTKLQSQFETQQQQETFQQQQQEFDQYLKELETSHGNFDKNYVTALISQGVDGAEAVKQYQNTINQAAAQLAAQQNPKPTVPQVMGGDGTTGSGVPEAPIKFGSMKNADVNQLVTEMLLRQAES